MSQALLVVLDPDNIATLDTRLDTRISVRQLPRLTNLLNSHDGEIEVSVAMQRGDDGFPLIDGRVAADLDLVCQRCLEPMKLPVQTKFHLMLLAAESEGVESPGRYEPYYLTRSRADHKGTRLIDIIEDELLLVLPFAPMHPNKTDCGRLAGQLKDFENPGGDNTNYLPFAVLKNREID